MQELSREPSVGTACLAKGEGGRVALSSVEASLSEPREAVRDFAVSLWRGAWSRETWTRGACAAGNFVCGAGYVLMAGDCAVAPVGGRGDDLAVEWDSVWAGDYTASAAVAGLLCYGVTGGYAGRCFVWRS